MNCPNCHQTLQTVEYEGIHLETCPGCGGEWLDADELGKIVQRREVQFDDAQRQSLAQAKPIEGIPAPALDRVLTCPKCGDETQPINYGGDSGIILDRCQTCGGFWLDADELERVQMLTEGWDDRLPQVMRQMAPRLQSITEGNESLGQTQVSRLPVVGRFINALVNGIVRLSD